MGELLGDVDRAGEAHIGEGADVLDEALDQAEAPGATDDGGVGGEDEEGAACVELFEGGGPGVEDVCGGGGEAAGVEGAEVEVGIVV